MWILHPQGGFLSAVQHNSKQDTLVVRARIKSDLEDLATQEGLEITGGASNTDYPWRVMVDRYAFASYLASLALAIDYGNFKSQVGRTSARGIDGHDRADIYSQVWGSLLGLENLDPNGRAQRLYY